MGHYGAHSGVKNTDVWGDWAIERQIRPEPGCLSSAFTNSQWLMAWNWITAVCGHPTAAASLLLSMLLFPSVTSCFYGPDAQRLFFRNTDLKKMGEKRHHLRDNTCIQIEHLNAVKELIFQNQQWNELNETATLLLYFNTEWKSDTMTDQRLFGSFFPQWCHCRL